MRLNQLLQTVERRNKLLGHALDDRGVDFKWSTLRKTVRRAERRKKEEDHSVIKVGDKHMSYHSTGYTGGEDGEDTMTNTTLKQAINFLKDKDNDD